MRPPVLRLLAVLAFCCVGSLTLVESAPTPDLNWYKGNLHTHTINSDGDSAPDAVARWYKEQRYHFLALTDHNYFTDPQGLNRFFAADERFLLLTGEEVTSRYGSKPIHVNAFRLKETIDPAFGDSVADTIQKNVDVIRGAGAIPSLNHPNFVWAVTPQELAVVENLGLFEVYNGHPTTNEAGGGGAASLTEMWDYLLSAGRKIRGIAVDDAHSFKEFGPHLSNPGRGWIMVRAAALTPENLFAAVEAGDFYASTGVELSALEAGQGKLKVEIEERSNEKYRVRFFGRDGKLLNESFDNPAQYSLTASDSYVRAEILDSNGRQAWTQPVFAE